MLFFSFQKLGDGDYEACFWSENEGIESVKRKDRGWGVRGGAVHLMKEREGGERINEGVRERQGGKNARPAVLNT